MKRPNDTIWDQVDRLREWLGNAIKHQAGNGPHPGPYPVKNTVTDTRPELRKLKLVSDAIDQR